MKKTKLENQQQVWEGRKNNRLDSRLGHTENIVSRLSIHRKKHPQFLKKNEAGE